MEPQGWRAVHTGQVSNRNQARSSVIQKQSLIHRKKNKSLFFFGGGRGGGREENRGRKWSERGKKHHHDSCLLQPPPHNWWLSVSVTSLSNPITVKGKRPHLQCGPAAVWDCAGLSPGYSHPKPAVVNAVSRGTGMKILAPRTSALQLPAALIPRKQHSAGQLTERTAQRVTCRATVWIYEG